MTELRIGGWVSGLGRSPSRVSQGTQTTSHVKGHALGKRLSTSLCVSPTSDACSYVLLAHSPGEVLEMGAYYAIKIKDIPAFERFMSQLQTYYQNTVTLPPSPRMLPLQGLNLLRLLSQNRISEFHTVLETIPAQSLDNVYIRHPLQIEQCLMEGSFNKVWNARVNVPAEEYRFFIDILMGTIRNEIADCSQKAYTSLPISDAATLLYFKKPEEALDFFKQRGWKTVGNRIHFGQALSENGEIPAQKMMVQCLEYAKELERIV